MISSLGLSVCVNQSILSLRVTVDFSSHRRDIFGIKDVLDTFDGHTVTLTRRLGSTFSTGLPISVLYCNRNSKTQPINIEHMEKRERQKD